jgi:NAD-dependent deacetylase
VFELAVLEEMVREREVPRCTCDGVIKPDVVFYGEAVHHLERAAAAVARSDLLLVLGSSLMVYPAAFLPEQAGGDVAVINKGEVGLQPGSGRYFVEADLDEYLGEVAEHLGST